MKKFILFLTFACLTGAGSLFAASFEGVVDYQMTMGDKKMDTEYMIKGSKFRTNMSHDGMDMSTIMDLKTKEATTLMHKQKMYMTHKLDKAMTTASKHSSDIKGKVHKVAGTKTILGYSCEHWVYEGKVGHTDIWGATGIGTFLGFSGGKAGSSGDEDWVSAIKAKGFFPLEVDSTGKNGKTMTMVATKVEEKSLSADLFEIPAGYKKMPDYSEMMKGHKGPSGEDMLKGMKPKLPF